MAGCRFGKVVVAKEGEICDLWGDSVGVDLGSWMNYFVRRR